MRASSIQWCTDVHLNFVKFPAEFGRYLAESHVSCALFTGDIAEAPSIAETLYEVQAKYGRPLYFVLGNHDYYRGTFESVRKAVQAVTHKDLVWLRHAPPVDLGDGTVMTGHDGWYDCRTGNVMGSNVLMADFELVGDLRAKDHYTRVGICRDIGAAWALEARAQLDAALRMNPKKVLFATHVPPFRESCWHKGKISDNNWLPWFTNTALADVLADVASNNPAVTFEVYCGHTHSGGVYRHFDNLTVYTGSAKYGAPEVTSSVKV